MGFPYFTTLQPGWLNAWIPSLGIVLIQLAYMLLYREGGRRATDTSWYTAKDKTNAFWSMLLTIAMIIVAVFVPFKAGTPWFVAGSIIFILSLGMFIAAFRVYVAAPPGRAITGGIYRYSRNPMYVAYHLGMLGVCVASASLWLLLVTIASIVAAHFVILGEERYCLATYGQEYREYKARTPRYFLIG